MSKKTHLLHYVIQGALIVLSVAALLLLRQLLIHTEDIRAVFVYADIVLMVFVVSSVILVCIGFMFRKEKRENAPTADDDYLLRLHRQARVDSLTELLNREAATERIAGYLKTAARRESCTLFIIDLDNFKDINDNFGHFEGDKVLKLLASKLRAVFRTDDIVGRLGGDEFIVLMKDVPAGDAVRRKADELLSALEYMVSGDDISVTVTGSVGISGCGVGSGKDFETLYREADEALYRAKLAGKNGYSRFGGDEPNSGENDPGGRVLKENSASIQLKALIDNMEGGIALVEVSDETRAIYLSRSCVKLLQLSYEKLKQSENRILSFIHRADAGPVDGLLRRGARSGEPVDAVFRKTVKDGRVGWFHMRAVRIPFESSDNPVLIAILTDVTNLKMAELNYEAQKRQLETVLKVSNIVTFEVDIDARELIMTDASLKKYGIDVHVVKDVPDSLIEIGAIHPDSIEECRRMYDEIYAGVERGGAIVRTLKTDGQYTIERFSYFTVFDENGRPVKAVGIAESLETFRNMSLHVEIVEKQFRSYSDKTLMTLKITPDDDSFVSLKEDGTLPGLKPYYETYSDLFADLLTYAVNPEERKRLADELSIDGLLRSHRQGRVAVSIDYEALDPAGLPRCYFFAALLFVNRLNDEMCVFVRVEDKSRVRTLERLTGVRLDRIPLQGYTFESLRAFTNALIRLGGREKPCAVAVFSVANYDTLRNQLGQALMKELLGGYLGKTKIVLHNDYVVSYDGRSTLTVLIPELESEQWLYKLVDETVRFLKKPAFYQFYEEDLMDYRCGVSVERAHTAGFDELLSQARQALEQVKDAGGVRIGFYGRPEKAG